MKNEIRKLTIGVDYKNSMHYIVGQEVLGGSNVIHAITDIGDGYFVWIENVNKEIVVWKNPNKNLPILVEFNINY
jgi:hypothetical protein